MSPPRANIPEYNTNQHANLPLQLQVYGAEVAAEYFIAEHEAFLEQGLDVQYYEFGNENYGSWEPPYGDYPVNGTLYGEAFVTVATAMKAKYPNLLLGPLGTFDISGGQPSKPPSQSPGLTPFMPLPRNQRGQPDDSDCGDKWTSHCRHDHPEFLRGFNPSGGIC